MTVSRTVLVVEDTELLRRMYSDRLKEDGFRVVAAADGLGALAALRNDTPDLILLDLVMPSMSGLEVLDIVKKDPRLAPIPVIVLSNLGQEADINQCMEMGAVDYLVKNDAKPAGISARVTRVLSGAQGLDGVSVGVTSYRVFVRDHEADAGAFVEQAALPRRLWCPACELELAIELFPSDVKKGWYDAHLVCPRCGREF
jgi:CheY-like chemotaxis protein